ncbi:MAG: hypothetical protein ACRDZR_00450 [Acidimicrobiales bacterium]
MAKDSPKVAIDEYLQDMALRLALHCVRNTVIEDYHAAGKLSDPEMKAFNKEVASKLYTILVILNDPAFVEYRRQSYFLQDFFCVPENWDRPMLDDSFVKALEALDEMRQHESS